MNMKQTGMVMATAVAAMFATAALADTTQTTTSTTTTATTGPMVHCTGVNSCKGQSLCKTATNACKGLNSCKGKGVIDMSKEKCLQEKGTVAE